MWKENFSRILALSQLEVTMSQTNNPLIAFSDAMADAVATAGAATVMVNARKRLPASGIVYEPTLVLTANHVVERDSDLSVLLANGSEVKASLAGRDPASDLAVLRLEAASPSVAQPASGDGRVGQLVLALGRPSPDGIEASLGVISATGGPARTPHGGLLERYLRTDTIPYPGFSGGPLVDAAGLVLGINTSGLAHGAALTIPASLAWPMAQSLAQHGRMRRGYLGVRSQPVVLPPGAAQALSRTQAAGLLLVGVDQGSPAGNAGLMVGDILVGIAGQTVNDPDELLGYLTGDLVGQPTSVEILRGGQRAVIEVTVGERK
jgi:S1-C subfamily serine protease